MVDTGHGPLPSLLLLLTVVTGVVDAVSYIALGHVFVANMTGNVVFLGFALAGASGLSAPASLAALGAFLLGAVGGGRLAARYDGTSGQAPGKRDRLVGGRPAARGDCGVDHRPPRLSAARYALIVPLAIAMGLQNATARRLAVPDLTTTVLTQTLTGFAAESRLAGASATQHSTRRLIPVTAMFIGALAGALLVININLVVPLAVAAALMALTAAGARRLSASNPAWALSTSQPASPGRPSG